MRSLVVATALWVFTCTVVPPAGATPPGTLDPSFGLGGRARGFDTGRWLSPESVAQQADGKLVVIAQELLGPSFGALLRYDVDGTLDPSFGAGGGLGLKQNLSAIGITPEQYTAIATGAGPSAVAALRTGKIDALVMWDAMLGAAENTGLQLRTVNIPLEDGQVGTTLATTVSYAKSNPKELAGYCRAMTKGLLFTRTNVAAAIRIFWQENNDGTARAFTEWKELGIKE